MSRRYGMAGVVLVILLVGVVLILKRLPVRLQPHAANISTQDTKTKGPASAPVKVVEYSDFECPACQKAQPILEVLLQKYPNQVQLTFRHFPLPGHRWSGLAHQAAECANQEGQFWSYHDRLYGDQAQWSKLADPMEVFLRYAKNLGLDLDRFAGCLMDSEVKRRVLDDKRRGEGMQVTQTPTFFFDGERVVGPVDLKGKGEPFIRRRLGLSPLTNSLVEPPSPAASKTQGSS